jgi:hypothetical protein
LRPTRRFRYQDPGEVGAESITAAGGARREDGHITAAASDVENVLPVLDLRGREQPRRQPPQHPLMPFTLLDELPPAGSVPVFGLLHIHRHEGHAMPAPVAPPAKRRLRRASRCSGPGRCPTWRSWNARAVPAACVSAAAGVGSVENGLVKFAMERVICVFASAFARPLREARQPG